MVGKNNSVRKKILGITTFLFIFVVSLLVLRPLFKKGFLITDDGDLLLIRLGGVIRAIRDLHFPVRMLDLYHGYGYPVMNFLYPLPFYIASLIYFFLPVGLLATFKLSIYLFNILAGIGAYLLARKITKNKLASITGAVLYLSSSYRMINIFYRASFAELLAHSILPFLFYWLLLYDQKKKTIYLVFFSLTIFLLVLSHNVIALLGLILIIFYNLFVLKQKKFWKFLILGILLATFFWLPALGERKYTHAINISLSKAGNRLVSIKNLVLNSFKKNKYLPKIENVFYLNISYFIITCFSIYKLIKNSLKNYIFIFSSIFVLVILASTVSLFFWQALQFLLPYIQFPWRLFSLLGILFLLGYSYLYKKFYYKKILIGLIILSSFFSVYKGWQLVRYKQVTDSFYLTNQSSSTTQDEYTPIWVDKFPQERPEELVVTDNKAEVNIEKRKTHLITFEIKTNKKTKVNINKHYFPGWTLYVDKQKKEFNKNNPQGIINFQLNKGEHQVELIFKETRLRLVADLVSVITFVYLLKLALKKNENS